jgi:hypothetical protein
MSELMQITVPEISTNSLPLRGRVRERGSIKAVVFKSLPSRRMGDNPSDAATNGGFHPPYGEFTATTSRESEARGRGSIMAVVFNRWQ